jgi:ankyrin repeat protein
MSFHKFILSLMILASVVGFVGCGGETTATVVPKPPVPQVETPKKPLPVITGNPNAVVGKDGETRLHVAAKNGNAPLVEALILAGADVNKSNKYGFTPLYSGHVDVVKLLLENGADVNHISEYGATPLHTASMNGHVEAIKVLLANGANVNQPLDGGWTPLHTASGSGYIDVVKVLLVNGANVNQIDQDHGFAPLHEASKTGHVEVVKVLLVNGADKTLKDNEGKTPLDYAEKESVKALLRF